MPVAAPVGADASVLAPTSVGARTTSTPRLSELLRELRRRRAAKARTSTAGAPAGGASTPTTTYAPSGGAAGLATTPSAATTTPAVAAPAQTTAPARTAPASAAKASKGDRPLSTGAIVVAALAALLVLGCLAWALARSRAFEPHWLVTMRHASAEAGFRASATWSEFADWTRLGR